MPFSLRGFYTNSGTELPFIENPRDPMHHVGHGQYVGKDGYNVGYGVNGIGPDPEFVDYIKDDGVEYNDNIIRQAVAKLKKLPEWSGDKYDLLKHNCHHFLKALKEEYNNILHGMDKLASLKYLLKVANMAPVGPQQSQPAQQPGPTQGPSQQGGQQPQGKPQPKPYSVQGAEKARAIAGKGAARSAEEYAQALNTGKVKPNPVAPFVPQNSRYLANAQYQQQAQQSRKQWAQGRAKSLQSQQQQKVAGCNDMRYPETDQTFTIPKPVRTPSNQTVNPSEYVADTSSILGRIKNRINKSKEHKHFA